MSLRIPLVVFRVGRRYVVGFATIDRLGIITIKIKNKDRSILHTMLSEPGEFSWGPPKDRKDKNCTACLLGLCGDEPKEPTCTCCNYDHVV